MVCPECCRADSENINCINKDVIFGAFKKEQASPFI